MKQALGNNISYTQMERTYPSWEMFKAKYPSEQLQRDRFEDLARSLFCDRFGLEYGILQCHNHAGNETQTITYESDVIGFNAKFFEKGIDADQIIASIETAHKRYPEQSRMLVYTNVPFGNPPKGREKTRAQQKVEEYASSVGIDVEWIMDKMILDHAIKLDWVYDYFFALDSPLEQVLEFEESNTKSILAPIRTALSLNGAAIKINFTYEETRVLDAIKGRKHIVIYGEGGCGKTALLKSIYEEWGKSIPFCIRKGQDIKNASLDGLFNRGIDTFLKAYNNASTKVMIIDSAERLQDLDDRSTFESLITTLRDAGWILVFTVRDAYMGVLLEDLGFSLDIFPETIQINPLTKDKLASLATSYDFKLPENESFQNRISTLFYLDSYLKLCNSSSLNKEDDYSKFSERIWKEKISGRTTTRGLDTKRSQTFIEFITRRISSDTFYLNDNLFDPEITQLLINDEVLARNDYGLFITHDIYEEWGIAKMISNSWRARTSVEHFFASLSTSYLVRKTFRQWLAERIETASEDLEELLSNSLSPQIEPLWKDEMLIGIMNSSYAVTFLAEHQEALLENDAKLLNRIVFLLQLACKRLDKISRHKTRYVPVGTGWEAVFSVLYQLKDRDIPVKYKFRVLKEWVADNHEGQATRQAGLLALAVWETTECKGVHIYDENLIQDLSEITFNAAKEIKEELRSLVKKIVDNKWNSYGDPYYEWGHYILTRPLNAQLLIESIPEDIFPLMDLFWRYSKPKTRPSGSLADFLDCSSSDESILGLDSELDYSYGSSWAGQTPLLTLLTTNKYWQALDYIIDFTNDLVAQIPKDKHRNERLDKVIIHLKDGKTVIQQGNDSLWGLYRGAVHITYPYIMQSMHMALERILLSYAADERFDNILKASFDRLLTRSQSVSLTAVVASVVLAHPYRYSEYAVNLFKTIELFHWDNWRYSNESLLPTTYGLSYGHYKEWAIQERAETLNQAFRKKSLEALCIEYQYTRSSDTDEEQHNKLVNEIRMVCDTHYSDIQALPDGEDKRAKLILLHKLDRRKHNPQCSRTSDGILINMNPQLPDELKRFSEEASHRFSEQMRSGNLWVWCSTKFKGEDVSVYQQYEEEPLIAIEDAKYILAQAEAGQPLLPLDDSIPAGVAGTMLVFYEHLLTPENLLFCKRVVEDSVSTTLRFRLRIPFPNSLEVCVRALPILIRLFPEDKLSYVNMLASVLHIHYDAGSKRVCDYAIETMRLHRDEEWYNTILTHYIAIASGQSQELTGFIPFGGNLETYISALSLEDAAVLLELLPYGTEDILYWRFIKQLLPRFAETLKAKNCHIHSFGHKERRYLYHSLASHALCLKKEEELKEFLAPFIELLNCDRNCADFIRAFIRAENTMKTGGQFWAIWRYLYQEVLARCIDYQGAVLQVYLLADRLSTPETPEWHCFDNRSLWLYDKASRDCGGSATTMYSIARNLNYFACKFEGKGIEWLYTMISKHPSIDLRGREPDTIFYMERFIGKVIRKNRSEIRKDKSKRSKLIAILSFMVERNSVQAFMLRDDIA